MAGCRRAVEDLVGGIIFYLRLPGSAGPFLLLQVRVEVPDTIYQVAMRRGLRRFAESLYSVGVPTRACSRSLSQPHSKSSDGRSVPHLLRSTTARLGVRFALAREQVRRSA